MQKSIVIRTERKLPRVVLIIGGGVVELLALIDSLSAVNLLTTGVFWFLGVGNPRVTFGEKFFAVRQEMLADTLISYRNIKSVAEQTADSRHGAKIKIVIQLHDERAIEPDVTAFKPEDRKRICELLAQKIDAIEAIRS